MQICQKKISITPRRVNDGTREIKGQEHEKAKGVNDQGRTKVKTKVKEGLRDQGGSRVKGG